MPRTTKIYYPISRGLSEEKSKNLKKIVTVAYMEGAANKCKLKTKLIKSKFQTFD
jgi:hypothetical protein